MNKLKKFDRAISFQRVFVELTGSINGALLLSQAVYWQIRTSSESGWWSKTHEEWKDETGLTRHELLGAKKACSKFLKSEQRGIPCRSFWKVETDAIEACISLLENSSQPLFGQPEKAADQSATFRTSTRVLNKKEERGGAPHSSLLETDGERQLERHVSGEGGGIHPARRFSDSWCAAFQQKFGEKYRYQSKDGVQAARLLKDVMPEEAIETAKKAWNQTDERQFWNCIHMSKDVAQFCSRYTKIRVELKSIKKSGFGTTRL